MSAMDVKKHGGLDRSWRLSCRALFSVFLSADADEYQVVPLGVFFADLSGQFRRWKPSAAPSGAVADDVAVVVGLKIFPFGENKERTESSLWPSAKRAIGAGGGCLGLGLNGAAHASKGGRSGCGVGVGLHVVVLVLDQITVIRAAGRYLP